MNELNDLFMLNAAAGPSVDRLQESGFDVGVLRPFRYNGRSWNTLTLGTDDNGDVVTDTVLTNAASTLTLRQWEEIDNTLIPVARQRLQFVRRLEEAGLVHSVAGGMGVPTITYQMVSDSGTAQLNMDAIVPVQKDRPLTDSVVLPLPIAQSDFGFNLREMRTAARMNRNGPVMQLDLAQGVNSARKIGELTERLFLGTGGTYTYGGGTIYGMINFPFRSTKVLTSPLAGGWTPSLLVSEVLSMIKIANTNGFYGPFELFHGPNWLEVMNNDYSLIKSDLTTLDRLGKLQGISQITQLDYLDRAFYDLVLVQMTADTLQVVNAMPPTPLQWETHGGLRREYKIMQIKVPRFYRNYNGTAGIVHGSVAV